MTFGLNALSGRKKPAKPKDISWTGAWNPENAHDFIQYTVCKGYNVDSWEFGNELSGGGVSAKVDAVQYGQDVIALKGILTQLYQNSKIQPKLWAPGGFFESKWFSDFLQASGPNIVDQITHHIYNLGSGNDPNLFNKIQDPYVLDNIVQAYRDVEVTLQRFGPSSDASISESGGAYNSGGREISHSFVNSFWYLDQLGMASTFNHKVYCRQSLIGGNYGLLNTTTMVPNPDYYSALLFHRLMGRGVLSTLHDGSPYLRAYSHCSRQKPGITLMLINLSNSTTFDVSVVNDLNLYPPLETQVEVAPTGLREEYHLTPMDGDLMSHTMLLNGTPLKLTCSGDIPPLPPKLVDACAPISISPSSILFVTLRDFKAPACH
ncbi:heparanase-like protein 2 [Magnolia sinica]|uniref:heparanase-like protein 2 n=1 Tax=Magnolia sinica TaxID=86752 RepID=UPI00265B020D|nr:heparanase-like protein 2 [Magnolia sinica]